MPKYRNAGGQPRDKCMVAAWALVEHYGASQADVAKVMGCSQPTIANWVKDVRYRKEISGLQNQLAEANDLIESMADELRLVEYNPDENDD
ncbi:helix-turn-helix domain-containing protein [Pseudomonas sp. PDM13]|uniref:helix-turn-helix domain-containing protein n=1 Tax=Pseudomonas sp. PDM13 TaxID=2769255 RepID=UPI0021E0DC86|nr:helix-turn-helix domain-containing protein [Pseudomonas sp. PDM13]MCU9947890.1 helix-turn-helix domain-containing protein [Pseudomonas sp. PDM13]